MTQRTSRPFSATPAAAGIQGWLVKEPRAWTRRPEFSRWSGRYVLAHVLRLAGVGLLVWMGYIHWLLWHEGYKFIPTDGPFFLVDAIAAVALAVALLAWPRPAVGLVSAAFVAVTIAALVISLWVGLSGFHESISASYVVQSLWLESVAVTALASWSLIALTAVPRDHP